MLTGGRVPNFSNSQRSRNGTRCSCVERLEPRRHFTVAGTGPLSIGGTAFLDADGSGYRTSADIVKSDRIVFVDGNQNGLRDVDEPFDTTDATGAFSFEGLDPGTYVLATELSTAEADAAAAGLNDRDTHFNIDLIFDEDAVLTDVQRNVFIAAARRWEQVIIGDLPEANNGNRSVDDVRINVLTPDIDGAGGALAKSVPTLARPSSTIPYEGHVDADSSDIAAMTESGQLYDVILHEIGHVLGIGTIWDSKGLVDNLGSNSVQFTGTAASAAYDIIFNTTGPVPVENTGGAGTRDTHWRDSVLNDELMSGFISRGANPLSRITIASMQDLGYQVNIRAADRYGPTVPSVESAGFGRVKVTLLAGQSVADLELPIATPARVVRPVGTANIQGIVFNDVAGNGLYDSGDVGLGDVTVFLDLNHNGRLERTEPAVQSSGNGVYRFGNLAAGDYIVRTLGKSGYHRTGPQGLSYPVTVGNGDDATDLDFGFTQSVGNFVETGQVVESNDLSLSGSQSAASKGLVDIGESFAYFIQQANETRMLATAESIESDFLRTSILQEREDKDTLL